MMHPSCGGNYGVTCYWISLALHEAVRRAGPTREALLCLVPLYRCTLYRWVMRPSQSCPVCCCGMCVSSKVILCLIHI